jgi:hypothetical protein
MESSGRYDFAVLGENLAAWTSALLLARQGERVLVLPDGTKTESRDRLLLGCEPGGVVLRLLERWGVPVAALGARGPAHLECLSSGRSLWLQGPLESEEIGSPGFELRGEALSGLRSAWLALDNSSDWKAEVAERFLAMVRKSTTPAARWLPMQSDAPAAWASALRRGVAPAARAVRSIPDEETVSLLKGGTSHFLRGSPVSTDDVGGLLFALHGLRHARELASAEDGLREEMRKALRAGGVAFAPSQTPVRIERAPEGGWVAKVEGSDAVVGRFDEWIMTTSVPTDVLPRVDEKTRSALEADLARDEDARYELVLEFEQSPFPFAGSTEFVARGPSGSWLRVSGVDRDNYRVSASVPVPAGVEAGKEPKGSLQSRLLREVGASLPGVEMENARVTLREIRERKFRPGIGVKGSVSGVWHAHYSSYPSLGDYGPFVAAVEVARRRVRSTRRELSV